MHLDQFIPLAFADLSGLLLRLLEGATHTTGGCKLLQEVVGSLVSLSHGDVASCRLGCRGSRCRGSGLSDLLHATIIACAQLLIHIKHTVCQGLQFPLSHTVVSLLQHTEEHTALVSDTKMSSSEHLLPLMPDGVVAMVHPAHVSSPVTVKAGPATEVTHRSGHHRPIPITIADHAAHGRRVNAIAE